MKELTIKGRRLRLIDDNIVMLDVEAIVNAANKFLVLGGGVAGAIDSFGGPTIQEECDAIGPIDVGGTAITGAGELKAQYVIHAVGPVFGEGNETEKLKNAVQSSLRIAFEKKIQSIAFPAISTGIFRFPIQECSEIMLKLTMNFLKEHEFPRLIILCLYGEEAYRVFANTFDQLTNV
ncbi:macro domain-containing protein [Acidobacteriota bacterium]